MPEANHAFWPPNARLSNFIRQIRLPAPRGCKGAAISIFGIPWRRLYQARLKWVLRIATQWGAGIIQGTKPVQRKIGGLEAGRAELTGCLLRVARGERKALEALYHLTSAKLFAICTRILSDRAEAEDVLQEVFLTVWNKAAQFDVERGVSPMTWLMSIARNRALDRLRAKKQFLGGLDEAAEIPDLAPLADAMLATRQSVDRLAACLEQLDARAQRAIRAAFFGGETYERLARAAEIPLGSMKSLIRRGLMRLKACLDP